MTTVKNITKFKVQGVGLDTSNTKIKLWVNDESCKYNFDYIHTSISSNNDYLISDYVKYYTGASLITSIDFIKDSESIILGHLLELERNKIDLLLIESSKLIEDLSSLKDSVDYLKKNRLIEELGISNPSSVDEIKQIEDALGSKIKFISLDICPLHFNYTIIQYCKDNNIDILGFNPFGGYISSAAIISSFTVPYLLAFNCTYSSIIFLSGRDLTLSNESLEYINTEIIGKDCSSKFILKKNVFRLYKTLKKIVETSVVLSDNLVLKTDWPEYLYSLENIVFNLGPSINIVNIEPERNKSDVEQYVYDMLVAAEIPENISIQSKFAAIRYKVLSALKIKFPDWKITVINSGSLSVGIVLYREKKVRKGFLSRKSIERESKYFLCALPLIDHPLFIMP